MKEMPNCIWYESSKMWKIRCTYYDDNHKRKERVFSSKKSKQECIDKYYAYLSKPLCEVYNLFEQDKINRLGINSPSIRDTQTFGRVYFSQLKKDINSYKLNELQSFVNNLKKCDGKDMSEKYLSKLVSELNQFLRWAYNNEYLQEQVRGKIYVPKGHNVIGKEILTEEEIKKFEQLTDYHYHPYLLFLLYTGARPGEALYLKKDQIIDNCAYINGAVNWKRNVTNGKNLNAHRIIPLCDKAIDMIKIMEKKYPYSEYVFCSKDGKTYGNQSTAYYQLKNICEKKNIKTISLYCLRHTYISRIQNVLSLSQLKKVVGHSDSFDSLQVYAHQTKELNESIINNLNKVF